MFVRKMYDDRGPYDLCMGLIQELSTQETSKQNPSLLTQLTYRLGVYNEDLAKTRGKLVSELNQKLEGRKYSVLTNDLVKMQKNEEGKNLLKDVHTLLVQTKNENDKLTRTHQAGEGTLNEVLTHYAINFEICLYSLGLFKNGFPEQVIGEYQPGRGYKVGNTLITCDVYNDDLQREALRNLAEWDQEYKKRYSGGLEETFSPLTEN